MLLSVIIPFHACDSLLERTLLSIIPQLDAESELVLVGDGVAEVDCENLQQKYPVIKVYGIEKAGANSARTYGIQKALGSYILLVDSDDELKPEAIQLYSNIIKTYNPDLILANVERIIANKKQGLFYHFSKPDQLLNKNTLTPIQLYKFPVLVCKCVQKKCIEHTVFENSAMFQDFNMMAKLFKNIQTLYYTNQISYRYYQRTGSTSSLVSNTKENILLTLPAVEGVLHHYKNNDVSPIEKQFLNFVLIRFFFTLIKRSISLKDFSLIQKLRSYYILSMPISLLLKTLVLPKVFLMGLTIHRSFLMLLFYYYIRLSTPKK